MTFTDGFETSDDVSRAHKYTRSIPFGTRSISYMSSILRTHFMYNFLYMYYTFDTHDVTDSSACRHPSCSTCEYEYTRSVDFFSFAIYKTYPVHLYQCRRARQKEVKGRGVDLLSGSLSHAQFRNERFRRVIVDTPSFREASIKTITSDSGQPAKLRVCFSFSLSFLLSPISATHRYSQWSHRG